MVNKIIVNLDNWKLLNKVFDRLNKDIYDYISGTDNLCQDNKGIRIFIKKRSLLTILKINKIEWSNP